MGIKQKKRDDSDFVKCKEFIDESKVYCDFLGFFSKPKEKEKEKEKESNMKTNSIHGSPAENESNQIGTHQQDNINDKGDVSNPNAESCSKANAQEYKTDKDKKGLEYINNLKAKNSTTNKNNNKKF